MRLLYHSHYSDFATPGIVGNERNTYNDIFLTPPTLERVSTELYMPALFQLFNSQSSDTQSWSSILSLSNQQRILPISGISRTASENLSQQSSGPLPDQHNHLVSYFYTFKSLYKVTNNKLKIKQFTLKFNSI